MALGFRFGNWELFWVLVFVSQYWLVICAPSKHMEWVQGDWHSGVQTTAASPSRLPSLTNSSHAWRSSYMGMPLAIPGPLCVPRSSPRHSLKPLHISQPSLAYPFFKTSQIYPDILLPFLPRPLLNNPADLFPCLVFISCWKQVPLFTKLSLIMEHCVELVDIECKYVGFMNKQLCK